MSTLSTRFRVLVLSDHVMFSEGLEMALTRQGHDVRAGTLSRGAGRALPSPRAARFDAALVDVDADDESETLPVIAALSRAGTKVVVVTGSREHSRYGRYLHAGARTVLGKHVGLTELTGTFRRLSAGLAVQDADTRTHLLRAWTALEGEQTEARRRLSTLTPREREVLGELMRGRTVCEIAHSCVVSEATVRTQVKSVLAKLEVSSQLAAVGMAYHLGWQPPVVSPPTVLKPTA